MASELGLYREAYQPGDRIIRRERQGGSGGGEREGKREMWAKEKKRERRGGLYPPTLILAKNHQVMIEG